jgi:hypothetical protein
MMADPTGQLCMLRAVDFALLSALAAIGVGRLVAPERPAAEALWRRRQLMHGRRHQRDQRLVMHGVRRHVWRQFGQRLNGQWCLLCFRLSRCLSLPAASSGAAVSQLQLVGPVDHGTGAASIELCGDGVGRDRWPDLPHRLDHVVFVRPPVADPVHGSNIPGSMRWTTLDATSASKPCKW